jgi:hypothetical protein
MRKLWLSWRISAFNNKLVLIADFFESALKVQVVLPNYHYFREKISEKDRCEDKLTENFEDWITNNFIIQFLPVIWIFEVDLGHRPVIIKHGYSYIINELMYWCFPMEVWLWTSLEGTSLKLAFSKIFWFLNTDLQTS